MSDWRAVEKLIAEAEGISVEDLRQKKEQVKFKNPPVPTSASQLAAEQRHKTGIDDRPWPPVDWKRDPYAHREVTAEEVAIEETRRRRSKNTIGQSEYSATTPERRESAVHHFIVSPPADMTKENPSRITGLMEIVSRAPAIVWKKMSPVKAFFHWLKGGQVKDAAVQKKDWRDADD